ncbi:MAG: peroxide stress protein YaaA [Flavobacteriales bacterium]|nr:peroxide stress protein YaaA [Flavobacteriales bacterium]
MLVVLSPAKKINEDRPVYEKQTVPQFVDEAAELISVLKKYTPKKLGQLMSLSANLSDLNVARYQMWDQDHHSQLCKTAVLAFDGEAYNGLDASSFSKKDMDYAQDHLRILSGLYGLLRPLDMLHPYRLEMGTTLKVKRKKNLYEFWGDKIVNEINTLVEAQQEKVLINLASSEYFKAINKKKLNARVITPVFKDFKGGEYKTIMVYAKKARGMMTRYILQHQIEKADDLIGFDSDGYCYNKAASTDHELVFLRG